jgi:hypothetical protein
MNKFKWFERGANERFAAPPSSVVIELRSFVSALSTTPPSQAVLAEETLPADPPREG